MGRRRPAPPPHPPIPRDSGRLRPPRRVTPFIVIIPARRASSRLPDKALADLGGRPLVVRVAERASESGAARVLVATDDAAIAHACSAHGLEAVRTSERHPSGTDRIAEVAQLLQLAPEAIVVNVQGDEPLVPPLLVARCAEALAAAPECAMATAAHPIHSMDDFMSPHVVKVVLDAEQHALYFSRAPIPFERDSAGGLPTPAPLRHVGLYAYRASFLMRFPTLAPAPLETLEKLEQLRALWHGERIKVVLTDEEIAPGVDTPADLARVRALFAAGAPGPA